MSLNFLKTFSLIMVCLFFSPDKVFGSYPDSYQQYMRTNSGYSDENKRKRVLYSLLYHANYWKPYDQFVESLNGNVPRPGQFLAELEVNREKFEGVARILRKFDEYRGQNNVDSREKNPAWLFQNLFTEYGRNLLNREINTLSKEELENLSNICLGLINNSEEVKEIGVEALSIN
jgi:hypothetical protein